MKRASFSLALQFAQSVTRGSCLLRLYRVNPCAPVPGLRPFIYMALLGLCLNSGCRTWKKSHELAVTNFGSGNIEASRTALQESKKSLRSEKKLIELDQGILDLASGDVQKAEGRFRTLRHELEYLEQKDITEQASSIMSDSLAVAYAGRDFERRMILNMALISSMLGDNQDAFAYSLQVTEAAAARKDAIAAATSKQKDPVAASVAERTEANATASEITPASFQSRAGISASSLDQPLALSAYLAAVVQSESPSRYKETEQALTDIGFWNPTYQRHDPTRATGEFGTRCQSGNGALHVIAFIGKAPRWIPESAEPTSAALLIADRIISATGKHTLPPTIASVKIARPEFSGSVLPVGGLRCSVGPVEESAVSPASLKFSTLVDLNEVAQASYNEHRDEEIAAVIARRVLKKGAVYVLKETQGITRNSLVDLGVNVAGVAWEAMEKADTRSWRMLPARIDIARKELPAGQWTTTLQTAAYGGANAGQSIPVRIQDGRNTYVLCIIPERELTGHILVGGADDGNVAVTPSH